MKPPKVVIPGLNRGIGVPAGYVLGRLPGTGQGPAQLLSLTHLKQMGLAATSSVSTTYVPNTRQIHTTSPILGGGPLSSDLTLSHAASGVTAGSYTNANITVDADGHITAASNGTGGGGSGTVTSVSVVTANGVSGTVATSTTTPAITLTLGAITPSSVAATGTVTGSNLSGTNTGDQAAANPSATASDTAVNGTATTFMRSDAAPAIQKASSTQFGLVKVDGTTITSSAGVISAVGGGGGGISLISEYVADGTTGTHTFSSIPGTYRALKLAWAARSDVAAISEGLALQFNGDTGANYDRQNLQGAATTVSSNQTLAGTSATIGPVSGSTASASACGVGEIEIPYYADTTFHKSGSGTAGDAFSTSSGGLVVQTNFIHWRSTAAITSITAALASGKFVTGSKVALYGIS